MDYGRGSFPISFEINSTRILSFHTLYAVALVLAIVVIELALLEACVAVARGEDRRPYHTAMLAGFCNETPSSHGRLLAYALALLMPFLLSAAMQLDGRCFGRSMMQLFSCRSQRGDFLIRVYLQPTSLSRSAKVPIPGAGLALPHRAAPS